MSWIQWAGSTEVQLSDPGGRPLAGARVEVRVVEPGGSSQTVTVTTDARGRASVAVGPYTAYGSWGTGRVQVEIADVVADGATWDGSPGTVTISAP